MNKIRQAEVEILRFCNNDLLHYICLCLYTVGNTQKITKDDPGHKEKCKAY